MELISPKEFRTHLQNQLTNRTRSNSRYSLRAFAKTLELDPSSVSQILSGKRKASPQMMERICEKVGWPPSYYPQPTNNADYFLLTQDAFAAISDWYHYAILDLTLTNGFKSDPGWIARRLGISRSEAQIAMERLKRLGMLVGEGKLLKKGKSHYANYSLGQTSEAHREYQRQIIRKALEAVDTCDPKDKDITCITIAANPRKLEAAREKIKKFRREICGFLEDGTGESVHVMAIQLFPLTKKGNL